ncbi:MAG TPA: SRPBCC family protein [Nitrososphaerales archaeon]|nr:SRPBCC family protein [Nitrososphaerales archaeon]
MTEITGSREIGAPVEKVWAVLVDWKNERKYWTNLRDIKVLKDDGSTIEREATVGPRGFGQKTKQKILLETPRVMKLTFEGEEISGGRTISLTQLDKKATRVDVVWSLDMRGVPSFVEGIAKNQISKATEDALKKVAEAVKGG